MNYLLTFLILIVSLIPTNGFAENVSFQGSDGLVLSGTYWPGTSLNAVIVLHQKGRTHQDLEFLAKKFNQKQFAVLSYDLRGHGQSALVRNGKNIFWDDLTRTDYQMFSDDLKQAIQFVRQRLGEQAKIYLLGVDLGATVILDFLSTLPPEQKYDSVLVSPGLDYGDLDINSQKLDKLKGRELLLVSGRGDSYSYFSCQYLIQRLQLKGNQKKFAWSARHGSALLFDDPKLVNWLIQNLQKKGKS